MIRKTARLWSAAALLPLLCFLAQNHYLPRFSQSASRVHQLLFLSRAHHLSRPRRDAAPQLPTRLQQHISTHGHKQTLSLFFQEVNTVALHSCTVAIRIREKTSGGGNGQRENSLTKQFSLLESWLGNIGRFWSAAALLPLFCFWGQSEYLAHLALYQQVARPFTL